MQTVNAKNVPSLKGHPVNQVVPTENQKIPTVIGVNYFRSKASPSLSTIEPFKSLNSKAEQVLNWHSRNARVQNRVLHSIDQKIDQVSHHVSQPDLHLQHLDSSLRNMYTDLQSRVTRLNADLHQYINQGYFGPDFDNKEREIRQLKDQLDQISRDHFTSAPYIP
ncbi:hypothetical protein Ddye_002408 [Dipteronia dyeriana]|uniref:Uncharacterized protein n=1 Tax=Dipteronia dyeriana TaxID=168575 RepID=A0AAE0CUF9_9ROSI|nr:hypothetical protein Ddye_002408 [Dipteronia dyeriana]